MLYIIADKERASVSGFNVSLHRTSGSWVVLNEKEVRFSQTLTGTLEERAKELGGKVYTLAEARDFLANQEQKQGE